MILIVQQNCQFCKDLNLPEGTVIGEFRNTDNGSKVFFGEDAIDPPIALQGLPTLVDGANVFVGKDPILKHLASLEGTKCPS